MSDNQIDATKPLKLSEIAKRIHQHLEVFAKTGETPRLYMPSSWPAGSKVGVRYISYQLSYMLTKRDALAYLTWLDAGNRGRHTATKRDAGSNAR